MPTPISSEKFPITYMLPNLHCQLYFHWKAPIYIATNRVGEVAIRINSSTWPSADSGNSSLLICPPNFPLMVIKAFLPSSFSPSTPCFSIFCNVNIQMTKMCNLFAIPFDERIMNEGFQYTHQRITVSSQQSHRNFSGFAKYSIISCYAHCVH